MTVTLAQMDSRVLGRVEGNSGFYQQQQRYDAINEAIRYTNLWTGFLQQRVTVGTTVPGRFVYDVPPQVLIPMSVWFDGKELRKPPLSEMATARRDFLVRTSSVDGMTRSWCCIGLRKVVIIPADMRGGHVLEVGGIIEPTPLVNPGDFISIPDQYSELVEEYAWFTLVLTEGGKVFADAKIAWDKFNRLMHELGIWTMEKNPRFMEQAGNRK